MINFNETLQRYIDFTEKGLKEYNLSLIHI